MKYLLSLIAFCLTIAVSAADKPNIVLILVDDMPWWGTSVAQQDGEPRSTSKYRFTPNVERLATQGMTFSNAYSAAGMCAPSRTSLQTGLSPARHLFSGNGNFGTDAPDEVFYVAKKRDKHLPFIEPSPIGTLNPKFMTIGEKLKEKGYATAHIGKWHLYGGGPGNHGYDVHDGETSNNEGKPESGIKPEDPKRIFSITDKSIKFIEENAKAGKPFYCQVSHYVEHNKHMSLAETGAEMEALPIMQAIEGKRDQMGAITSAAAVKDLDTSVGMLLDKLEALGVAKNTYVIFTSDNGYHKYNGEESILRGDKWWLWEAGVRVPFMIMGPGIKAGSRSSLNISNYDLLPTFYEMAGGDAASIEKDIDGKSLKGLFEKGAAPGFEDRALYFHYPHYRMATPHSAIIRGEYKLYTFYERPDEPHLYKLSEDLGEETNLAQSMPEKAQDMLKRLQGYLSDVGAYLPKENPDGDPNHKPFDPEDISPPLSRGTLKKQKN